jgi:diguanylate cyclase (GGDEF)-like protein/PAS domain S-box-containing protein
MSIKWSEISPRYKQALVPLSAFLAGAFLLSSFSLIQKRWLGLTNIFTPQGFVLPIIFGGGAGLLISWFHLGRKNAADRLRQSQEKLQDFLDNASDLIQSVSPDGHLTYVNTAWRNTLKYTDEDLKSLTVFDIVHPDEREHCMDIFRKLLTRDGCSNIETVFLAKDGSKVIVSGDVNCRFEKGVPISTRGIFRDVTESRRAHETERLAAKVFDCAQEAIMIIGPRGRILKVNRAFSDLTGYPPEDVIGGYVYEYLKPDDFQACNHQEALMAMSNGMSWQGEIPAKRRNGEIFLMGLSMSQIQDGDGLDSHLVAIFTDITDRKQYEKRLEHLATHDRLTNLPNRALLQDRLEDEIWNAQNRAIKLAVLFIDLDGFKVVNDLYGHDIGDRVIQSVAVRIRDSVRKSDLVARVGGDEFAIVAGDITEPSSVILIAEKVLANTSHPYDIDQYHINLTASIGISFYPECQDPRSLLIHADLAMYQAKQDGKNTYRVFKTNPGLIN